MQDIILLQKIQNIHQQLVAPTHLNNMMTHVSYMVFIYGLSCSQVGFQSGTMSSPTSNINFQFDATIDTIQGIANQRKKFAAPMVAMFLQDAEIIIQVLLFK